MPILNESLEWRDIARDPSVVRAFRGVPNKKLIPANKMLCRFITAESKLKGIRGNEIFRSVWWLDWDATWSMICKFRGTKTTPPDVVRA